MLKYHIQTIEVPAGGSSAITFTNIPQIYDDLVLVTSLRSNRSGPDTEDSGKIEFNGSSANFSYRALRASGDGVASVAGSTNLLLQNQNNNNTTANTFTNAQLYVSSYTSSNNKSISVDSAGENNATIAWLNILTGVWANSAAITSLAIQPNVGTAWMQFSSASLYGIKRGADGVVQPVASGGTVTTSGGYTIHTFTASSTFVANRDLEVEYLVIAGGGGGGCEGGGGGGAGGYRSSVAGENSGRLTAAESKISLTNGSYAIAVGAGGTGSTAYGYNGNPGTASSFASVSSLGGGGGKTRQAGDTNASGGSGGGGGYQNQTAGLGTANQGFNGGTGNDANNAYGGGGGAGSIGSSTSSSVGANGGSGISSSITGTSTARAGGGGGGSGNGAGGTAVAGGGNGSGFYPAPAGGNATANTGGGGGGQGNSGTKQGGNGGSGIVIIRYLTPA